MNPMIVISRPVSQAWRDGVYVPDPGCTPPAIRPRGDERVLHVALKTASESQPQLTEALASLCVPGGYDEVNWLEAEARRNLEVEVVEAAARHQPTLIVIQTQRRTAITRATIYAMREASPGVTIVQWDGDQHHEPRDLERRWFVELGEVCDASLVVNTKHPAEYAALGVRHPGYLQIGVNAVYQRHAPIAGVPEVVFLASAYEHLPAYERRRDLVAHLHRALGPRFQVYGSGWRHGRPTLRQDEEAAVLSSAQCAISMSIRNDLPRYTSDRLFRALACGAVTLVERFPDMEGLGLVEGQNCLGWSSVDELLTQFVAKQRANDIRANARALIVEHHTWAARMPELMAIVEAVRGSR